VRILFLTTVLPVKARSGGEFVTRLFIEKLNELAHNIDVVGYLRPNESLSLPNNWYVVKNIPIESNTSKLFTTVNILKSIIAGRCYSVQKFKSRGYIKCVNNLLNIKSYDFIIIDHFQMGWLIDFLPTRIHLLFISHNVESDLYKQLSEDKYGNKFLPILYKREAKLMKELEAKILKRAIAVWVLTETNKLRYKELYPDLEIDRLLPVQIPPLRLPLNIVKKNKKCDIGLLGTWSWEANMQGLLWFFKKVYPLLPNFISIYVAGVGAERLSGRFDNVQYLGFVDNADNFINDCKVVAIPSIAGDGIQIKTIHTISLGQRVVATSFALRGVEMFPSYVFKADAPTDFAELLLTCVSEDYRDNVEEAKKWCEKRNDLFTSVLSETLGNLHA